MGEARERALYGLREQWGFRVAFDSSDLYQYRQAHPKGRKFSCYQREFKVNITQIGQLLQRRGEHLLQAAGLMKAAMGARFLGKKKKPSMADLTGRQGDR